VRITRTDGRPAVTGNERSDTIGAIDAGDR